MKPKQFLSLFLKSKKAVSEYRFGANEVGLGKGLRERLKQANLKDWRFDWAFPEQKIAVEYEGIVTSKSRHTTLKGYTGDCEKYNSAMKLGWKVFRYTALNYKDVTKDLEI